MGQNVVEVGVPKFQLLPACEDDHEGVIVDMKEPMDPNVFQAMLKASLSQWKLEVHVPMTLVQVSVRFSTC